MDRAHYMIIGNSVAAVAAVAGIRVHDRSRPITMLAREPRHTYSRPLISYLLAGRVDENQMFYRGPTFYEDNCAEARLGVEIVHVDPLGRTVETAGGQELGFERLLIATGGSPVVPPALDGAQADGVFTFTTWDDAEAVRYYIQNQGVERAVVVGAGLIGIKALEALVAMGLDVTVVELADQVLSTALDRTAGELTRQQMERAGVDVRTGTTISRIETIRGAVSGAVLRDGQRVKCGMVILAIGVRPNTALVADTAIELDRGILADHTMQTSVEGIYAAGDVAQAPDLLAAGRSCIPIFPDAYRQGVVAGRNMAGGDATYDGGVAMNSVDVFGLPTISVGVTVPGDGDCETLCELDREAGTYRKVVLRGNRVVGAVFVGSIDRAGIITGLIRGRVDVNSVKDLLLTDQFGLLSLPQEYRKHVVSGAGIEV
ncbi:MAG: FAD-dependent oxidoreductase [Candidatus Brocadiia bacterium]